MPAIPVNHNPPMTKYLVERTRVFRDYPITIVDVGARGGFNVEWRAFGKALKVICFEPDEAECARLNAEAPPNVIYLPVALGRRNEEAVFYETRLNFSSGLYKTNMDYFSRLLNRDNGEVVGEQRIRVTTLDEALARHGITSVDFIKLDVEGAELDVLIGGERYVRSPALIGILSEFRFQEEINGCPVFWQLEAHARQLGFRLYGMSFYNQSRHVLPYEGLMDYRLPTGERFFAYTQYGQIMDGDALYFRDLLIPANAAVREAASAAQLLKAAAFFEIYYLGDCAGELILAHRDRLAPHVDCDILLDLLTPPLKGVKLGYKQYIQAYFHSENGGSTDQKPLVSIFSFCKDCAPTIRRSIESVLKQSYRNIEFVVQDGASTDGTREILESYGDPRIKLVSEPDSGHCEAFWKVFQRCNGVLIGSCLSDEELRPDAVELAVQRYLKYPQYAAFYSDMYMTDAEGNIKYESICQPFNLINYLFNIYVPFWPSAFFRRSALADIGLFDGEEGWAIDALEMEIWLRLGTRYEIGYFPGLLAKYALHEGQQSNNQKRFFHNLEVRINLFRKIFSENGFFGADPAAFQDCLENQLHMYREYSMAWKHDEDVERLTQWLNRTISVDRPVTKKLPREIANETWEALRQRTSPRLRGLLHPQLKRVVRNAVKLAITIIATLKPQFESLPPIGVAPKCRNKPERIALYRKVSYMYEARGQTWPMWLGPNDDDEDLETQLLRARLKLPRITSQELLELQLDWAHCHARPKEEKLDYQFPRWDGERPINVAYLSPLFDEPAGHSQIIPFVRAHDRTRVKTFAYAPWQCPSHVSGSFDVFRVTGQHSDEEFINLCRADGIDVVVEMTGLAFTNRFAALASRCAPVQISTFDHTGTTGVTNVEWVLADEVSAPPALDPFYSEKIYRLKGCFLSSNYKHLGHPDPGVVPAKFKGYVTFGCFGSGSKINEDLIALWARVLKRVPGSRLLLQCPEFNLADNRRLRIDQFRKQGIGRERLDIRPGTSHSVLLRNFDEVDISLDTWPYCGGTTICESLWQGVPVVSLLGERFSSRYGSSILCASGCGDLVANTPEEYVEIAGRLAEDLPRLDHYRANLRQMMFDHGLSDTRGYAKKLEDAYRDMLSQVE